MKKSLSSKPIGVILAIAVLTLVVMVCAYGAHYYRTANSNFHSRDGESHGYYVYPGASLDSVMQLIFSDYDIASMSAWEIDCRKAHINYPEPGYYRLDKRMANRAVLRMLRNGNQTPIRLTFNNSLRNSAQLAGRLGEQLLTDSATLKHYLDSTEFLRQYDLTPETAVCLFIPNTYEVYWTITPEELFERMHKEYKRFWTDTRCAKAKRQGLTPVEVSILASIVECETHRREEHPTIASLYLNRLRKDMCLQACPTVIYAVGDFSMRRVLNKHLQIDSPYNTYKYKGLPPGPIRLPQPSALDAVLDAPQTDYLFMCANPDFSGTHIFTTNGRDHEAVARQYQRRLNEKNIKK